MKKISLLIVAIFTFLLVGCSSNHEKSSLNDNKEIVNAEKSKENNSDITNNNDSSSSKKDASTMKKNIGKSSKKLNNKQISKGKLQKNVVKKKKAINENCPFKIGMSIDTVKNILKKNNMKIENEIEVTSKPSDPSFGNKQLWVKGMTLEFNKNTNKLCSIQRD